MATASRRRQGVNHGVRKWGPRYGHAPILRWRDGNTDGDLSDEGDSTLYYGADANFNVTALVDTSGAAVERYLYEPYGKVTVLDPDWSADEDGQPDFANELLFTGHRLDGESGLYYALHRHYHPTLGRWVSRDPKGYVDGMGLYEYVQSAPIWRYDLEGAESSALARLGGAARCWASASVDFAAGAVGEYLNTVLPVEEVASRFGCYPRRAGSEAELRGRELGREVGVTQLEVEVVAGALAAVEGIAVMGGGGGLGLVGVAGAPLTEGASLVVEVGAVPVAAVGAIETAAGSTVALHGAVFLRRAEKMGAPRGPEGGTIRTPNYSDIPDPKNVGQGKDFTAATKKKILEQNRRANEGVIRSDQSGVELVPSEKSQAGVTPQANEAQVDHVMAKSKGGTNSASNAQVLSREENRVKSDD